MTEVVGRAYVVVKAITKGLDKEIDDAVKRSMAKAQPDIDRAGASAGASMGDAMGDEAGNRAAKKIKENVSEKIRDAASGDDISRAGALLGEAIGRDIDKGLSRFDLKSRIRESLDIDDATKARITAGGREIGQALNRSVSGALQSVGKLANAAPPLAAVAAAAQAVALYAGQAVPLLSTLGQAASGAALGLVSLGPAAIVGLGAGITLFKAATPELEEFKEAVSGLGEQWSVLGSRVQEVALPAIQSLAETASTVLPQAFSLTFKQAGDSLAGIADRFRTLLEDSGFVDRLARIGETGAEALGTLGEAIADIVESLVVLFDNLRPLTIRTSEWIAGLTETWKQSLLAAEASGKLGETLDRWADAAAQWGQILRNTWEALKDIFAVASPGAKEFADDLEALTARFADWTASVEGQERITQYFEDSRDVFDSLNGLLVSIGEQFKRAFELSPGGTDLVDVIDYLADEVIPNLGTAAIDIQYPIELLLDLFEALNEILASLINAGFFSALGAAMNGLLSVVVDLLRPIAALVDSGLGEFLAPLAAAFAVVIGPASKLGGVMQGLSPKIGDFVKNIGEAPGALGKLRAGFGGLASAINPWTAAIAYGITVWGEYSAAQKAAQAAAENFARAIVDLDRAGRLEKLYDTLLEFKDTDFLDTLIPFADWSEDATDALQTLSDAGVTSLADLEQALYEGGDALEAYIADLEEVAKWNDDDYWRDATQAQREQAAAADALLVVIESLSGEMENNATRTAILEAATGGLTGATEDAADAADVLKLSWEDVGDEIQREAEAAQAAIDQTIAKIDDVGRTTRVKIDAEFEELELEEKLREAAGGVYNPETGEVEVEPVKLPVDLTFEDFGGLTPEQRDQVRNLGDYVQAFLDDLQLEAEADPTFATDANLAKEWNEFLNANDQLFAEVFPGFADFSDEEKAKLIANVTGVDIPTLQTDINVDEAQARAEAVAAVEAMVAAVQEKRAELEAAAAEAGAGITSGLFGPLAPGATESPLTTTLRNVAVNSDPEVQRIRAELAALELQFGEAYLNLTVEGQDEIEDVQVAVDEIDGSTPTVTIESNADDVAADVDAIGEGVPEDGIEIEVGTTGVPEAQDGIDGVVESDYEATINTAVDGLAQAFSSIQGVALQEYLATINVQVDGLAEAEAWISSVARDRTATITVNQVPGTTTSGSGPSGSPLGASPLGFGAISPLAFGAPAPLGASGGSESGATGGSLTGSESGSGGFVVNIGSIENSKPTETAREVIEAFRVETYRMGVYG